MPWPNSRTGAELDAWLRRLVEYAFHAAYWILIKSGGAPVCICCTLVAGSAS